MGPPGRRDVAAHGVGRQVEHAAVAAGGHDDGVRLVAFQLAGDQVAHDDAARLAVDEHQVQEFLADVELDVAQAHLAHHGLVGAQQQLLARLAAGVERARNLGAAEGAVLQESAVVAREGHAQGHALVDDVHRDLGQAVHVGLAGAEVPALDGVVEQALHAVAVVGVVLGGVDAALGRDAMGAAGAVLPGEGMHVVAELGQGGGGGAAGQAGAHHDDLVLPLVGRVHQLHVELVVVPLLFDGAGRNLGVEDH